MFVIREATVADREAVEELTRARALWMADRGVRGARGWERFAEESGRQAADPDMPVWVLVTDTGRVIGRTTLGEQTPVWGWTEDEQAQPAYFLNTTVTHPEFTGRRAGSLLAWWAVDRAAATGREWVRRAVGPDPGLLRYYCDVQGWRIIHRTERYGEDAYMLGRAAEPLPDLARHLLTTT
ncbi:GNAT family N-acetyltransferase [Streptomyces cucumeris]|uniref:GNAT family N-acetyltransferase n=1 Tax=Streptomyces cucumeris TaxID=2962890 RepID=UPI003D71DB89